MSSGQIYVPVMAQSTRSGVNGLDPSDPTHGGEETAGYIIHWNSNTGYTGQGWCWDEPTNYLQQGWKASFHTKENGGTYENTLTGFEEYMQTNPANLDDILGAWPPAQKSGFVYAMEGTLGIYGGYYGANTGSECIEYLGD